MTVKELIESNPLVADIKIDLRDEKGMLLRYLEISCKQYGCTAIKRATRKSQKAPKLIKPKMMGNCHCLCEMKKRGVTLS